jgi:tetratricopeptide (TPR) repeat protein
VGGNQGIPFRNTTRLAQRAAALAFSLGAAGLLAAACGSSPTSGNSNKTANQLVSAGLAAEKAGNTDEAVADYKAAVAKDSNNVYAHYDLGYIYQERGDSAAAATEYRKALLINPKFVRALYNMGVLEGSSDPALAISYYEQDLALEPRNAAANFNLGVLLYKQGQTAQGVADIETALRLEPSLSADLPAGITVPTSTTTTTS